MLPITENNEVQQHPAVPRPCCAAVKRGPMSALLEDAHPVIQESHSASPAKTAFRILIAAVIALPALMAALSSSGRRTYSVALMVAVNSIAVLMLLAVQIPLISGAYVWTPAAWLACFLYARRGQSGIEPVKLDCRVAGSVLVAFAGIILGTLRHALWPL
jgi:hypothetical protein